MFEAIVLFIRDGVVRPGIGGHDADRFLPFILTLFFFILLCNLMGMIPGFGSPTAALSVTAPLALITFLVGVGAGMKKYGAIGFWIGLCPPIEVSLPLKIVLVPMLLVLEIIGMVIRYGVLAVRLLANMFGGHLGLAIIMAFIPAAGGFALVARCDAGDRLRRNGHKHVGVVRGLFAGLRLFVPGGVVYRNGGSSALERSERDCCRDRPSRSG